MQSEARIPIMVLEVAISDPTDKLHEDAQRWLNTGITKLVILVDITETGNETVRMISGGFLKLIFDRQVITHFLNGSCNGTNRKGFGLLVALTCLYIYGTVTAIGNVSWMGLNFHLTIQSTRDR
jgi:hypothetical protein